METRDVLVVDDDAAGRDALSQLLAMRGYTVREAENGRVALDLIAERVPGFLVLDLEMPVMDGWEVLASLHRSGAFDVITVVVVSAGPSPPSDVAFLRKPCEFGELLEMLIATDRSRGSGASSLEGRTHGRPPARPDLERT
ncbi:response regulator receiver protein [Anaeromyxobacter dehalogenans 2CP-1]|uniref:Response regulator receiver protein n=1 Tax=Anaeromyxobacter dehalogenans (strain ATCC BAA-258 / DSM 21875 / 2CP-1) TaxID=455488 RepID=B8J504_ANAD2|nr:response regulator [Anaeromyxobacter dehalogenans]ACL64859.1 response regulator receiver protein [Anaeromyxobacter dehalogenans 2CP-1]